MLGTVAVIATAAGVAAFGVLSYHRYRAATASPSALADSGVAILGFDASGVDGTLRVTLAPSGDETAITYDISVDNAPTGEDAFGFALVTTKRALVDTSPLVPGVSPTTTDGCWRRVYLVGIVRPRCTSVRTQAPSLYVAPEERQSAQLYSGTLRRNTSGKMFGLITTYVPGSFFETRGHRTVFLLPAVGTTPLPVTGKESFVLDLGDATRRFVPRSLRVVIDSNIRLGPTDRLESASPSPVDPATLAWVVDDAAEVKPQGSFIDTSVEAQDQRDLFIAGVFAGAVGSALVTAMFAMLGYVGSRRRPRH